MLYDWRFLLTWYNVSAGTGYFKRKCAEAKKDEKGFSLCTHRLSLRKGVPECNQLLFVQRSVFDDTQGMIAGIDQPEAAVYARSGEFSSHFGRNYRIAGAVQNKKGDVEPGDVGQPA
jgi:hypothetical protein